MATKFTHHVAMSIGLDEQEDARNVAAAMSGNPHDAQVFFVVRCSDDGEEPADTLCACTGMTAENVKKLPIIKAQFSSGDYLVLVEWRGTSQERQLANFEDFLDQLGKQRILPTPNDA